MKFLKYLNEMKHCSKKVDKVMIFTNARLYFVQFELVLKHRKARRKFWNNPCLPGGLGYN